MFLTLYAIGTFRYSGGSLTTPNAQTFLWTENYFCDLMNSISINGKINLAQPYAITSLISICLGLSIFFIWFSKQITVQLNHRSLLKILGVLSMVLTTFIFTRWHNNLIITAIVIGIIPIYIITITIIRNIKTYNLWLTVSTISILTTYILMYYLNIAPKTHPVFQKGTLLIGIIWIIKTIFSHRR